MLEGVNLTSDNSEWMLPSKIEQKIIDKEKNIDQSNKHEDVKINDCKFYACDLRISINDSDNVRIKNIRLKLDKQLEQSVVRKTINSNTIDEMIIKETVESNRTKGNKKATPAEPK